MAFGQSFWLKFGDVTVTSLDCIVMNFFHKLTLVLSYQIPKFAEIEYGWKTRSTFQNPYRSIVLANI